MNRLTSKDLQSGTVRAQATDLLTGATQELSTKVGSICQFFEPFECGGYKVHLRLDWGDPDNQGNPTLDADFYDLDSGKINKSMKAHPAHHTHTQNGLRRIYRWEFADELRKLQVMLTWTGYLNDNAELIDDCSIILIREGKVVPE